MNLTESLSYFCQTQPQKPALVTAEGIVNYHDLEVGVNDCCDWLMARRLHQTRRIALMIRNELLLAHVILACARLGLTFITIPRSATLIQRQTWANYAQIDYLIKDDRNISIPEVSSFYIDVQAIKQHDPLAQNPHTQLINKEPDLLMIVIGSGSTGTPKLIPIEHTQMKDRAQVIHEVYEFTATDRIGTMAHLEYTAAITRLFTSVQHGLAFVLMNREDFDLFSLKETYGITRLSATVFHVENMLIDAQNASRPILQDIHLSISSSPVSDYLRQAVIEKLTPNLWIAYGTNEVWTTTIAKPQDVLKYSRTVGTLAPQVQIQIVNEDFQVQPCNTVGLICIRSAGAVNHYLNPEASDRQVFHEGWFMPKDLGMLTPDGHLIFYGRSDNMMIFNGINIYPAEIENCLANHPCVKDVIAIPLHDPMYHQIPIALVSLHQAVSESELLDYCQELMGFRGPQKVHVVPDLQRNKQGKIPRAVLQELLNNSPKLLS